MKCQICHRRTTIVYKKVGGINIYECSTCKFGFVKQVKSLKRVKNLYDYESYKGQQNKLKLRTEKLIERILKFKKKGTILEVGGGFGLFSSVLQSKGNFVINLIEPDVKVRYFKKPFTLFRTTFEKFREDDKRYDIIFMMDVLEHFKDPLSNLRKAHRLLKKNGLIVIQTPNYKSLMAKICRNWAWWMIEDHKFFYSPKSLRLSLEKSGFKPKLFLSYEDWEDLRKNLDGNFSGMRNNVLRKISKGIFFSIFKPMYILLHKIMWKMECGGLLFVISN